LRTMGAVKRRAMTLVEVFGGEACDPEDSWRKAAEGFCGNKWTQAFEEREAQRRRAEAAEDELSPLRGDRE
jgi:hypothetical protein